MRDNRIKEHIFRDIRNALLDPNNLDERWVGDDSNTPQETDRSVRFAQQFVRRGGKMFYSYKEEDIALQLRQILDENGGGIVGCGGEQIYQFIFHLGIENCEPIQPNREYNLKAVLCEALTCDDGGVVITSNQGIADTPSLLQGSVAVLAFTSQVVNNWEAVVNRLKNMYEKPPLQIAQLHPNSITRNNDNRTYLILIEDEI